jgi:hypothetical protein
MGHANGEVAERAHTGIQVGLAIVVRRVLGELFWCALGTEVVGMGSYSVVAVVRTGDDHGEQLALHT